MRLGRKEGLHDQSEIACPFKKCRQLLPCGNAGKKNDAFRRNERRNFDSYDAAERQLAGAHPAYKVNRHRKDKIQRREK